MTTTFPSEPTKDFNSWATYIFKLIHDLKR